MVVWGDGDFYGLALVRDLYPSGRRSPDPRRVRDDCVYPWCQSWNRECTGFGMNCVRLPLLFVDAVIVPAIVRIFPSERDLREFALCAHYDAAQSQSSLQASDHAA